MDAVSQDSLIFIEAQQIPRDNLDVIIKFRVKEPATGIISEEGKPVGVKHVTTE